MLTDDERRQGAQLLFDAERQREAIPQLSKTFPGIEIVDAYRIQDLWAELKMALGVGVAGHKIGLTSRAMQMASKMTEPDYGRIYDDAIYNDGAQIPAGRFLKPRLEVELAFVMGEDLEGPGKRIYDVMRAAEYVIPALEIIDYRTEVPRAITDTIADNAAFGAIVVGGRPIRPMDVDIRWVGATLSKNGTIEESGVSAAIMGHPSGRGRRLARQQTPRRRREATERSDRARRFVHPPGRHRPGRCDSCGLRSARRNRRFICLRFESNSPSTRSNAH